MGCQNQWTDVTDTEISDIIQKADLNTEQKSSAGAMDSEFQSLLQYVVQKGNITYPPDNWIDRKNNNYLCCKYP